MHDDDRLLFDPTFQKWAAAVDDSDSPSPDAVASLGLAIWNKTYAIDRDTAGALINRTAQYLASKTCLKPERLQTQEMWFDSVWSFAASWADAAFQKIVFSSHKYAAALLCSDAPPESVRELRQPWPAFLICVPDGLIAFQRSDGAASVERIGVSIRDEAAHLVLWGSNYRSCSVHLDFERLMTVEDHADGQWLDQEERVHRIARRLIVGAMLSMQHLGNVRRQSHAEARSARRGPPRHRVTVLGAPIAIDCRPAVAEYLVGAAGDGAPPSVQTMVRGHFKRQAHGAGRSERKVIWVEPYWRGPEDAPILARPVKIATRNA